MSLSQKLYTLDEARKKKIEAQLQEKFPNSVEVQVLFLPRVLEWIDSGLWKSSNGCAGDAYSVMNGITTRLQEEISRSENMEEKSIFQFLLSSLQNAYCKKPIALVETLVEIYSFIQNLVDSEVVAGTSLDETVHSSSNDDVTTEDQSFDFDKNLESLEALVKENNNHIREIQQKLKEREKLVFSQNNLEIENLKITKNNSGIMQEKSNKLSEITKRIHENKNDIDKQNQSIAASLKPLFENISGLVFTKNKDLQSRVFSQISEWNHTKLRAQVGWPVHSFSGFLQPLIPVCDRFTKVLLSTHSQTQKLVDFLTKKTADGADVESLKQGENMRNASRRMFCGFLKRCFVVDKQPPPTQLIDKVSSVSLRLLLGNSVLSPRDNPAVTCSLHLDDDIRCFQRANFENVKAEDVNLKSVTNNKKALNYDDKTNSFFVSFDKLKLPRKLEKRKTKLDGDKTKLVTDQKNCLMFQTQITVGTEKFTIEAFSVPIVVMTNTSQCLEAEATIFWDNAFSSEGRQPFVSPDKVPLTDFLEALNKRWAKSNERELEERQLNFLARKLIPGIQSTELHEYYVTKQMFNKEQMWEGNFPFTFWSWFYKALRLVKEFLYNEWRDGKIYGFIDKSEAEVKLSEHLVGTCLLRFSDSIPGGISIVYKETMEVPGCSHVWPWIKDELKQKSFSNSMNDLKYHKYLKCIQYLYPSATPISEAFPQQDENNSEEVFNPRYPKKAILRVVRHDDGGSTSASNFSSNQSVSFYSTSPPPPDERMSESTCVTDQPFSPSLSLDSDPMFSQNNQYYPPDFASVNTTMEGDNEDLLLLFE